MLAYVSLNIGLLTNEQNEGDYHDEQAVEWGWQTQVECCSGRYLITEPLVTAVLSDMD